MRDFTATEIRTRCEKAASQARSPKIAALITELLQVALSTDGTAPKLNQALCGHNSTVLAITKEHGIIGHMAVNDLRTNLSLPTL